MAHGASNEASDHRWKPDLSTPLGVDWLYGQRQRMEMMAASILSGALESILADQHEREPVLSPERALERVGVRYDEFLKRTAEARAWLPE